MQNVEICDYFLCNYGHFLSKLSILHKTCVVVYQYRLSIHHGDEGLLNLISFNGHVCLFQVLSEAGFTKVDAQDRTDLFIQSLEKELGIAEGMKDEFIKVRTTHF